MGEGGNGSFLPMGKKDPKDIPVFEIYLFLAKETSRMGLGTTIALMG
jgi:hypothetical protein